MEMNKASSQYGNLFLMALLSFISMYALMYMMVNQFSNVYPNLNQFYMAAIMTAPMIIIELLLMKTMYPNKITNIFIIVFSLLICILFITLLRYQIAISDKDFLKSMIPHHAGAILMCSKASLNDPENKKLCESIISSQQSEIEWMKMKLNRMKK
jgi:uncharacterized protein YacL